MALAGLLGAAALVGCSLPVPAGTAPLRYRDVVFPKLATSYGLTYGSAPGRAGAAQRLTLDLYRPAADRQTRRPAIVLVHGGGFTSGDSHEDAVVRLARAFAGRGYVAASINYRLLGDGHPCGWVNPPSTVCTTALVAAQHDTQAAVRWLRAHAAREGIDPTRIAVAGDSAGAVTALAVGVNSGDPGTSGTPGYSSKVGAAIAISGALPHAVSVAYDAGDPPVLMLSGTADHVVPFSAATQTAGDLFTARVPVVFEPLQGAGHVPFSADGGRIIAQSVAFAYYMLDLADAAGQPPSAAAALRAQWQLLRPRPQAQLR